VVPLTFDANQPESDEAVEESNCSESTVSETDDEADQSFDDGQHNLFSPTDRESLLKTFFDPANTKRDIVSSWLARSVANGDAGNAWKSAVLISNNARFVRFTVSKTFFESWEAEQCLLKLQ